LAVNEEFAGAMLIC